jgi:hypothetical protein
VRGRLAAAVREEQLGPALALKPDLATVVAGMNDLLRPRFDAVSVVGHLGAMFAKLTAAHAQVATVTFPDIANLAPVSRPLRPRVIDLNERIRAAAARHDIALFDTFTSAVTTHPGLWSLDRIHASPEGHARIAAGMAYALGLPGADTSWATPLPARRYRHRWCTRSRSSNGLAHAWCPASCACFAGAPAATAAAPSGYRLTSLVAPEAGTPPRVHLWRDRVTEPR